MTFYLFFVHLLMLDFLEELGEGKTGVIIAVRVFAIQ